MDELQQVEGFLRHVIDFQVDGVSLLELASLSARVLVGDVDSPTGWAQSSAGVMVWLLSWSWLALRLQQQKWGWSLACFAIGYELSWFFLIAMHVAADRVPQFILYGLPVFGWTLWAVTALTALLFWQNGFKKAVFGVPRLMLNFAEKRDWLNKFHKGGYEIREGAR